VSNTLLLSLLYFSLPKDKTLFSFLFCIAIYRDFHLLSIHLVKLLNLAELHQKKSTLVLLQLHHITPDWVGVKLKSGSPNWPVKWTIKPIKQTQQTAENYLQIWPIRWSSWTRPAFIWGGWLTKRSTPHFRSQVAKFQWQLDQVGQNQPPTALL